MLFDFIYSSIQKVLAKRINTHIFIYISIYTKLHTFFDSRRYFMWEKQG
jgi:hypothetical protein